MRQPDFADVVADLRRRVEYLEGQGSPVVPSGAFDPIIGHRHRGLTDDAPRLDPSSAWNGAHLMLGVYHLWVDATGDLRIKSSAPTSDTDGTIVGTQS